MEKFDLHGMTSEKAIARVSMIFFNAREEKWDSVEIVTGKGDGVLMHEVMELCDERGFDYHHPNGNLGSLIIKFDWTIW